MFCICFVEDRVYVVDISIRIISVSFNSTKHSTEQNNINENNKYRYSCGLFCLKFFVALFISTLISSQLTSVIFVFHPVSSFLFPDSSVDRFHSVELSRSSEGNTSGSSRTPVHMHTQLYVLSL